MIPKGRLAPSYRLKDTEGEVSFQLPVERYQGGVQLLAMPNGYWLKDTEDYALFGMSMMGELTKLCAYDFSFGFRYLFI